MATSGTAKLTDKQRAFVHEYIKDWNATQAAIRAGYSEKTANEQGSRLLVNVSIKELILDQFSKLGTITQLALAETAKLIQCKLSDFVTIDAAGQVEAKPFEDIPIELHSLIKGVSQKRVLSGTDDKVIAHDTIKYELLDKQKAIDNVIKLAGLLAERIDLTSGGEPITSINVTINGKDSPLLKRIENES